MQTDGNSQMITLPFSGAPIMADGVSERAMHTGWVRFFKIFVGQICKAQYRAVRRGPPISRPKILQKSGIHFSRVGYLSFVLSQAFTNARFCYFKLSTG